MDNYNKLAEVYDILMDEVDYESWAAFIDKQLKKNGVNTTKILELASGTGNMTEEMIKLGYSVTASDISEEMLMLAREKLYEYSSMLKFLMIDMTDFRIKDRFDVVLSVNDGLNYILDNEDVSKVFENVYNHMNDNGLFIFDISSEYKIGTILGDNTLAENHDDFAFIWENYYDKQSKILEFDLSLFIEEKGKFNRHMETHRQKAHNLDELEESYQKWFEKVSVFYDFEDKENDKAERIIIILRKR